MTRRGRGRPPYPDLLTPAEQRVLDELRKGGTNAEIAVRLGVSPDAVKYHVSNMLGKLHLPDRHALAAWRPEKPRRVPSLSVPATLATLGRPVLWTSVALAGVSSVAVVLVVLLVVLGVGESGATPTAVGESGATPTAVAESDATPSGPPVMFGDGTYRVGEDIPPGLYRSDAPSEACEWRRLRTLEAATAPADDDDVIGFWEGSALSFVDIAPTDAYFTTRGCGVWATATPRITPGDPFGDGIWLVTLEVAPGRYRAAPDAEGCAWYRLGGFTGELLKGDDSHLWKDLTNIGTTHIIDIAERDAGFVSEGCGEWSADLTPRITPGQPFGDGTFLVGAEILPGRYRASSATEECQWQRLSAFTGDLWPGGFVALGANPTQEDYASLVGLLGVGDSTIVEIAGSDVGFHSRGCGPWSLMDGSAQVAASSFGDGTHVVGSDIAPGRYRTTDPATCTWERLSGFGGTFEERLPRGGGGSWDDGYSGSPETAPLTIVDIAPTDAAFSSHGCGTWSADLAPAATKRFGDGTWLVGPELSPGHYQASEVSGCIWLRLGGFSGGEEGLVEAEDYGSGFLDRPSPEVELFASDVGFFSHGCGTWRLLNALGGSALGGPDAPPGRRPPVPPGTLRWAGDGTHRVGPNGGDWSFGLYRTTASSPGCSWEVRVGEDRFVNRGFSAVIIQIRSSDDEFTSGGCGTWTTDLKQRVWPGEPFEDGAYFVGWEVIPGRYRASQPDSCSWVRLSSFRGFPAGDEPPPVQRGGIAEITDSDAVFASQGCGTWTRVE